MVNSCIKENQLGILLLMTYMDATPIVIEKVGMAAEGNGVPPAIALDLDLSLHSASPSHPPRFSTPHHNPRATAPSGRTTPPQILPGGQHHTPIPPNHFSSFPQSSTAPSGRAPTPSVRFATPPPYHTPFYSQVQLRASSLPPLSTNPQVRPYPPPP